MLLTPGNAKANSEALKGSTCDGIDTSKFR
jgi:hypothetical protein